jgi:hypothetical protein
MIRSVSALLALSLLSVTSCSHPAESIKNVALMPEENLAAASKGARAIASNSVGEQFAIGNLNDGTSAAWGAAEGQNDVYAGVVLPQPAPIREYRIWLFTPNQPPRAHLRDIRVLTADAEGAGGPNWRVVRSRISIDQAFSEKITIPPEADGSVVGIELDSKDPNWGSHKLWGFGCLTASKGDLRNYLSVGTGVYVRELQMK